MNCFLAVHENWNSTYDPSAGRWLSPEPLLQSPDFARAMAKAGYATPPYAYANNNPGTFVDADGLSTFKIAFRVLGAGIRAAKSITRGAAINRVAAGKDVVTDSSKSARALAKDVSKGLEQNKLSTCRWIADLIYGGDVESIVGSGAPVRLCKEHPRSQGAREHSMINRMVSTLDEKNARRVVGLMAARLGHGGITEMMVITGLSRNTITRGQEELSIAEDPVAPGRVRAAGGGRPRLEKKAPL